MTTVLYLYGICYQALEQFSCQTRAVSLSLDDFTRRLRDSAAELCTGATLEVAQTLLVVQGDEYARLKEEILLAAKRGETLLGDIRQRLSQTPTKEPSSMHNITAVERCSTLILVALKEVLVGLTSVCLMMAPTNN